jgi:hypothetical protein
VRTKTLACTVSRFEKFGLLTHAVLVLAYDLRHILIITMAAFSTPGAPVQGVSAQAPGRNAAATSATASRGTRDQGSSIGMASLRGVKEHQRASRIRVSSRRGFPSTTGKNAKPFYFDGKHRDISGMLNALGGSHEDRPRAAGASFTKRRTCR